ncbi:MAG: hypothetical protein JW726_15660 [Anaerolineales bacterium]|nr:hypothetical protein [Anaerolineales bacterium]
MFNFLKSKKDWITITLDRQNGIYYPGETVGVNVQITPEKDLKLQGATVKLKGTERFYYSHETDSTDSEGNSNRETNYYWGEEDIFTAEENFLGEIVLPRDTPQRYSFQMALPADALPSCKGDIMQVKWAALVKLDRRMAGDKQTETGLQVLWAAPGEQVQAGDYGTASDAELAEIAFALPGLEAIAGQIYAGQLRITPLKDFDVTEIRLEVIKTEYVNYKDGNVSKKAYPPVKVAGNTSFAVGKTQLIPFQVSIPADANPSLQASYGNIAWKLRATFARRLRKDTTIEQDILVYLTRA